MTKRRWQSADGRAQMTARRWQSTERTWQNAADGGWQITDQMAERRSDGLRGARMCANIGKTHADNIQEMHRQRK